MVVLGCGDRNWTDPAPIRFVLAALLRSAGVPFTVIEGQCPYGGADRWIAEWAEQNKKLGVKHVPVPAEWRSHGPAAGPIRNRQMMDLLMRDPDPDKMVVAFHPNLMMSRGTLDMVTWAERYPGVPIWVFDGNGRAKNRTNRQAKMFEVE